MDGRLTMIFSEIFGPIMPIVPVEDVNEAIRIIKSYPKPLVIHVFTESEATKDKCAYNSFGYPVLRPDADLNLLTTFQSSERLRAAPSSSTTASCSSECTRCPSVASATLGVSARSTSAKFTADL